MQKQTLSSIQSNDDVCGYYLINSASLLNAKNGNYWRLELKDATAKMEAKIWSPLASAFAELQAGQFIYIEAKANSYKDQVQLNIDSAKICKPEDIADFSLTDFLPSSPVPPAEMYAELEQLCKQELKHKAWKKFVFSLLRDKDIKNKLLYSTAAKSVHHAYIGGLLEHQLSVAKLCLQICEHYPNLDRQILFAAALFHDIGKTEELSSGLVNDYTDAGRLIGHINLGLLMLEPFLQSSGLEQALQKHFKHLLLSHHGEREYGSPVVPATREAFVLHFADNIDAKLAQFNNLFSNESQSDISWSAYQNLLARNLCQIAKSPEPQNKKISDKNDKAKSDEVKKRQCSLL